MADPPLPEPETDRLAGNSERPAVLALDGVSKAFGSAQAVDDVSLTIFEGEFFSLLGPSGCGKTTLLRLIAGFERPDQGSLLLDGRELGPVPPYLRPVNMMFQSYALFPHMTVEKNIAYGLKQQGLTRDEQSRRVEEALHLVKLETMARRKPHQLSGGERQRVALARCLARKPRILLLDEPLAALDKRLREAMRLELVNLQRHLGTTFIMVTHDQQEALGVSTRLAVMRAGRIVQMGDPRGVYETPRSRYVAEFLGDANLFDGVVRCEAPQGSCDLEGAVDGISLRCRLPDNIRAGERAVLAVRPEKMTIHLSRGSNGDNCVGGTVEDVGYQGHLSIYRVRIASTQTVLATCTNPHRNSPGIGAGDEVCVSWPPEAGVLMRDD